MQAMAICALVLATAVGMALAQGGGADLTDSGLTASDLQKLAADVPIHVTHRKPGCAGDIEKALRQSGERRLRFLSDGDEIDL